MVDYLFTVNKMYVGTRIADPQLFNADQDPGLAFPTKEFDPDPESVLRLNLCSKIEMLNILGTFCIAALDCTLLSQNQNGISKT